MFPSVPLQQCEVHAASSTNFDTSQWWTSTMSVWVHTEAGWASLLQALAHGQPTQGLCGPRLAHSSNVVCNSQGGCNIAGMVCNDRCKSWCHILEVVAIRDPHLSLLDTGENFVNILYSFLVIKVQLSDNWQCSGWTYLQKVQLCWIFATAQR